MCCISMRVAVVFSYVLAVTSAQLSSLLGPVNFLDSPLNSIGHFVSDSLDGVDLGPLNPLLLDAVQQTANCALINEWTDPYLGTVKHDNDYCDPGCSRFVRGVTCCSPVSPKTINATFLLFQRDGYQRNLTWDEVNSDWAKEAGSGYKSLVIATSGFLDKVVYGSWLYQLKDGYLNRGVDAFIMLGWGSANALNYFEAVASLRTVGMMMGKLIVEWNLIDKTTIVGFSLGGQIIGEAGKYVQEITGGRKIKECHGLDPAGPFFDGCGPKMVLDKSDCELVQVIHSSAESVRTLGVLTGNLGTYQKSGHCDYWINCGFWQKACGLPSFVEGVKDLASLPTSTPAIFLGVVNATMPILCQHFGATNSYVAQARGECHFDAQHCPDCGQGVTCNENGPSVGFGLPPDSRCDPSMDVNFYVRTKQNPFDIHYC